eukprot:6618284-Prymnesium_polylepis.1
MEHTLDADYALCEIARRLLGKWKGSEKVKALVPEGSEQKALWAKICRYLNGRIQGLPEEKQGRTPDMSATSAAAMRAVLHEIEAEATAKEDSEEEPSEAEHLENNELESLVNVTGLAAPVPGPWLAMMCEVAEKLPQAMLI